MRTSEDLLKEAESTERLASLVSYGADKQRLLQIAADLRRRAEEAGLRERRSWKPGDVSA
jgi:aryl carrier-like protein